VAIACSGSSPSGFDGRLSLARTWRSVSAPRDLREPLSAVALASGVSRRSAYAQDTRLGIAQQSSARLQVRRAAATQGSASPALGLPASVAHAALAVPCDIAIYYRTDDYVSLPGMDGELWAGWTCARSKPRILHRTRAQIPRRPVAECSTSGMGSERRRPPHVR
jgi:hypothetical protein